MRTVTILVALLAGPLSGLCHAQADAGKRAAEIRDLTGAHTRVLWVQDGGPWGGSPTARLMGFDTDDGKGVRPLVAEGHCSYSYFTPNGDVVFTRTVNGKNTVTFVNWDGTGLRPVIQGAWLAGVSGEADGTVWLYCFIDVNGRSTTTRFRLDKPGQGELMWDKCKMIGRFSVSPDGMMGGGVYNDPGAGKVGVFMLPNVAYQYVSDGCQPSVLPCVNPYRLWVFSGDHRSGNIFTIAGDGRAARVHLPLGDVPGSGGGRSESSFPKWSNNVRFMVVASPFSPSPGANNDLSKVEISLGRIDPSMTRIEKWVQVTANDKLDSVPEAWIDPGKKKKATPQAVVDTPAKPKPAPAVVAWPGDKTRLVYLWENAGSSNEITDGSGRARMCIADARGRAVFGRYGVMDVAGGTFAARLEADEGVLDACGTSGAFTLELMVRPERCDRDSPARILSFAPNFTLAMLRGKLVLRLRTSRREDDSWINLGALELGRAQHVIVSFGRDTVLSYIDGKNKATDMTVRGNLRVWKQARLAFGDDGGAWAGTLEGVAIYARALSAPEVRTHAEAFMPRLKDRKPAGRIVVEAKLVEVTPNSTPKAIAPYHRLLLVDAYEVMRVVEGRCDEKMIAVARWGILGDTVLDLVRTVGTTSRLVLEAWEDNPQLESERISNDNEDMTLPCYYNVERGPKTRK